MAHEQKFDPDDPVLARVRDLALAMPSAREKVSHGRPAFFTRKVFAYYGGSRKVDGTWIQHPQSIMVQPDARERAALLDDERVWIPGYIGPSGWLAIDIGDATDWDEVAELLDMSYRMTAAARLVDQLDEGDEQ
ncbi:MAG TPA: MmcQ/YjbR family DNA-binding protein [Nitriliruptoraceae bacterium]|nr:MmcQ/YjbR family DNA-binding protein [Nitriliruptoraceae bacterium]